MSYGREPYALACWSIPTIPPSRPLSRTFRRTSIHTLSEPLTRSSTMRYAVMGTLAGSADAIRLVETARVHHAARRRGSVASRGARAAGGEAADHRILRR